ncbi:putative inactive peptidyl-prolyl cis-trans isomerase-like 6 isoform X4 [Phascolarctos cinereus]
MDSRPTGQPSVPHPCPSVKQPPQVVLQLKVVGLFKGIPFQIARCTAECLKRAHPDKFKDPIMVPLHEFAWHEFLQETKRRPMVFLEISINEQSIGRLIFELYADLCPKTCQNFQSLCTGNAGFSQSGLKLHYKHTIFHRLVKNGWLQGGDENFAVPHDKRGVLGMANKGRHTNGSQFYITLQKAPYLDRKYVAFGQLIEGTRVLQILEVVDTLNERPVYTCRIIDCGNYR